MVKLLVLRHGLTQSAGGLSFVCSCMVCVGPQAHCCFFIIFRMQNFYHEFAHDPFYLDTRVAIVFLTLYISWEVSRKLLVGLHCSSKSPCVFLCSQPWGRDVEVWRVNFFLIWRNFSFTFIVLLTQQNTTSTSFIVVLNSPKGLSF